MVKWLSFQWEKQVAMDRDVGSSEACAEGGLLRMFGEELYFAGELKDGLGRN